MRTLAEIPRLEARAKRHAVRVLLLLFCGCCAARGQDGPAGGKSEDLTQVSIENLLDMEVTSAATKEGGGS